VPEESLHWLWAAEVRWNCSEEEEPIGSEAEQLVGFASVWGGYDNPTRRSRQSLHVLVRGVGCRACGGGGVSGAGTGGWGAEDTAGGEFRRRPGS
jgi:hypothetical protein